MEEYIEEVEGTVFPGLKSPCNIMVSGVSNSGKTTLVRRLLVHRNDMFTLPVEKILYCLGAQQPIFQEMKKEISGILFHGGVPTSDTLETFTDGSKHCIVVLDDLMEETVRSFELQNLFTKEAHHKCISVVFITQNMFVQGKCARSLALNCHYYFVLCNPRDINQINVLANQTGLGNTLKDSYKDCVLKQKYGYQLIKLHPADIPEHDDPPRLQARIHASVFPGENLVSYL